VAFRATSLLSQECEIPENFAPLLWMQNVQPMQVIWPAKARGKAQYIAIASDSMPLLVPMMNYVVMRRFSAKEGERRIIAAPLPASMFSSPFLGLENHLNYVYRPDGTLTEDEAFGLAALFNSEMIDRYFRISNGNTQVSATELRAMPLPSLELIVALGRRVRRLHDFNHELDRLVEEIVGIPVAV
jgi:adenine-specific DNA-methyltransferase